MADEKEFSHFLPFSREYPNKKNQKENYEREEAANNELKTTHSEEHHHHELVSAQTLESDIEFTFDLHMQEAMSDPLASFQRSTWLDRDERDLSMIVFGSEDVERLDRGMSDSSDDMIIIDITNPLNLKWTRRQYAQVRVLFDGALFLDFERLRFFVDFFPSFQYNTRRWAPKSLKITALATQVFNLQKTFSFCHATFVAPKDNKFAFKISREALVTCTICFVQTYVSQIFTVDGCLHRYCFSCMNRHVEAKLRHGMLPKCPHENCTSELNIDSCSKILTPKLIEIMGQRLKEAAIPATQKVYCPYPKCSALMSKTDLQEPGEYQIVPGQLGARRCTKCSRIFCIQCKVPWHNNMTCVQYNRSNPRTRKEDAKLKSLSKRKSWRQCAKCYHMIERARGCRHMRCRCGYQFCYDCGKEWKRSGESCRCHTKMMRMILVMKMKMRSIMYSVLNF